MKKLFFIVFLTLLMPVISIAQESEENESPESIKEREMFIHTRRSGGPHMFYTPNAYENAIFQKDQIVKDRDIETSPTRTINWITANPKGLFYSRTGNNYISGRTNSIAFTNSLVFYIAAAQGGVWKTLNGGVNWIPLTDNLPTLACGDVVVNPSNPNIIYLGTGELNYSGDSQYGDGIFKSGDGGLTWLQVAAGSLVGTRCSYMAIDPVNTNNVYFAGNNGVFKSTNSGLNWVNTNSGNNANCLIIDPTNTQVIYITTGGTNAGLIRKSTDGGSSWVTLTAGLPSGMGRIQLAMAPSNSQIIYASISSSGGSLVGLYRTTNAGNNWTLQASSPNYLGSQGWYDNAVTVNSSDPNIVVTGGLDLYVSTNGGVTLVQKSQWATTNSQNMTHADIHRLAYNGTVLYCMSDGGVYKSTNNGSNWVDLNHDISTLQYQSADYDISNIAKLQGGTQDNNKMTSTNAGVDWDQRTTGDGGYTIVDPVTTNVVYGQYVNGSIQRSMNSGVSFSNITPSGSSGGLFYNPYEMAPGDHNTIIFGRANVWKTTNAQTATTSSGWTQIAATGVVGGSVSAIGISWTNTNKIYIGTSNGRILVTTDNGANWSVQSGFPYVSDFIVDNANDNICYATLGGTSGLHVLKTTNGGGVWVNISSNIPNIAANSVVLRTAPPRMIIVGTDLGVFQSIDEGASWVNFSSGMPAVEIYDLKYKQSAGIILAATHGRGCWTFDLGAVLGVDPYAVIPKSFELSQNYPNPFNPETKIKFGLPKESNVMISVYDISGKLVNRLVNQHFNAGTFEVTWNASNYSSGVYFYKLETDGFTETKKMILTK
ncbi:MAG: T9SS type A sorting domain-containing protein [Ignavibacteria bacterium]|nr:T9SS type A sorting domain-containing protein [Ignavibacteria bacterium]